MTDVMSPIFMEYTRRGRGWDAKIVISAVERVLDDDEI